MVIGSFERLCRFLPDLGGRFRRPVAYPGKKTAASLPRIVCPVRFGPAVLFCDIVPDIVPVRWRRFKTK